MKKLVFFFVGLMAIIACTGNGTVVSSVLDSTIVDTIDTVIVDTLG